LTQYRALLTDDSADIFERYRALFALRNLGGEGAVEALGSSFASNSALLKHEVAYVLGQMQNKQAVQTLRCECRGVIDHHALNHSLASALSPDPAPPNLSPKSTEGARTRQGACRDFKKLK
jgi:deoxyhypusine monooxygenase